MAPVRSSDARRWNHPLSGGELVYVDAVRTLRCIHPAPGGQNNRYRLSIDISTDSVSRAVT